MDYNITYREKDKGIQFIISYKLNGKWKQKAKQGFKKKSEAKKAADKALEELKEKLKNEIDLNNNYNNITFAEFIDIHLQHISLHVEPYTLVGYKTALKKFKSLYNMKICDIKQIHIQNCVDDLVKMNLKDYTIKTYIQKLAAIFNSAINQYQIIITNPVKNIRYIPNKNKNEKKVLNDTELNDLLSKIENKQYYIMTLLASKCGLRIGEILGLTWDNIDEINKTIIVNKQWKLNKDGKFGFGELKSKNSYRKVPCPKIIFIYLKTYKKVVNIDNRIVNYKNTISSASNIRREYKKLGYGISIHELRHTYATKLISSGMDFKTAANILGHDIEMTMKIYSHVTDEMMEHATNIIEKIF
ncbi:tyrosine-type recombinase/integrase [Clostridium botulinum]|uniref:tyrosine-type recombinase/integrase n=1 Tax=Clostridium botulinum TaxID=1491 RepID=UPI000A175B69|nr:site-specific integrase [Clostridium botulinum]AUN11235.1 site-specific integrase [Clostridium botulinum]OSA67467.1 site-specific integrase [Clostridium botulinum]OSB09264.1 site-specific integrase [Clostridium botulinum]